mgnify:CR=1 FL=1
MKLKEAKKLFEKGLEKFINKEFESSIVFFESSLKLAPNRSSTLKNLVVSYLSINNLAKAEEHLKSLIINNGKEKDIIPLINKVFRDTDNIRNFIKFINSIKNENINPIFKILKDLSIPKIFENKNEIKVFRENLEKKLDSYINSNFKNEFNIEKEQLNPPIFSLSYDEFNNKKIFTKVVNVFRKIYPQLNYSKKKFRKNSDKIKIGFISQFFSDHTIGKLFKGIIFNLDNNKFDINIFHTQQTNKTGIFNEIINHEKKSNIKNFILPNNFHLGIKTIENNNLDLIFYPDIGMSKELYFYTFLKLAKYQITSWGHPETTGNHTIDYFLSSKLMETKSAQINYSEKLLLSNYLPMYLYKPVIKNKLSDDDLVSENIYSCPQTLVKIHPDFDLIVDKILKQDRKAKIYFMKDTEDLLYKKLLNRFKTTISSDLNRIIFLDRMSVNDYINHCGKSSVLLDPIYFGAGNSFHESMYYGTPTISNPTNYMKSRIVLGGYKQMKIENPPITKTVDEYIYQAVELANNKKKNLEIKKYFRDSAEKYLFENKEFIKELEDILIKIALQ